MSFQTIDVTYADGILRLVLNRPEVMNALNSTMRLEIAAAMGDLPEGTRCVVLTGAGERAFCSGQDLSDGTTGLDVGRILRDEYEPMVLAIQNARVPVIAAVNGVAAGAGASIALAADVVVAAVGEALRGVVVESLTQPTSVQFADLSRGQPGGKGRHDLLLLPGLHLPVKHRHPQVRKHLLLQLLGVGRQQMLLHVAVLPVTARRRFAAEGHLDVSAEGFSRGLHVGDRVFEGGVVAEDVAFRLHWVVLPGWA